MPASAYEIAMGIFVIPGLALLILCLVFFWILGAVRDRRELKKLTGAPDRDLRRPRELEKLRG